MERKVSMIRIWLGILCVKSGNYITFDLYYVREYQDKTTTFVVL